MANRIALTIATISFSLAVVTAWASLASAADYHPATGKGNAPSAARAKMAREQAPGGCVVRFKVTQDGAIHRISRCEFSR